jgi:hypothetical protein
MGWRPPVVDEKRQQNQIGSHTCILCKLQVEEKATIPIYTGDRMKNTDRTLRPGLILLLSWPKIRLKAQAVLLRKMNTEAKSKSAAAKSSSSHRVNGAQVRSYRIEDSKHKGEAARSSGTKKIKAETNTE